MSNYLVISAIGQDRPGIVDDVSAFVLAHDCNVEDSRMAVLGEDFALIMLVVGGENEVTNLSQHLPELGNKSSLTIVSRPAGAKSAPKAVAAIPYNLKAVGMDHTGIVHNIAHLLAGLSINVESAETSTSHPDGSDKPIFSMNMKLTAPSTLTVQQVRTELAKLSQELNLEISIEPAG